MRGHWALRRPRRVQRGDAENPYWEKAGAVTFADPDGWRVVLCPRPVF
ncbi:hypothetical protein [Nocardia camponoti]